MTDSNVVSVLSPPRSDQPDDTNPLAVIRLAIDRGASPEALERLMALQERWEASQARREFAEAMAAARAEIKPIEKTRMVSFGKPGGAKTTYAHEDLAGIADYVVPILSRHGLSYRYSTSQGDAGVSVSCIIFHRSGHSETTTLAAGRDESGSKNHIQALGSTVTYLQRYTLKAALGLAVAADTDGRTDAIDDPKLIDEAQFRYLQELIEKAGADEAKMLAWIGADRLEALTQKQFRNVEAALRKKIAAKEVTQ